MVVIHWSWLSLFCPHGPVPLLRYFHPPFSVEICKCLKIKGLALLGMVRAFSDIG